MTIRKYQTDGSGYIRAEVTWDANTPVGASASQTYQIPDGGIASLSVRQEEFFLTVNIVPEDIPFDDVLRLPISPGGELPVRYAGCTLPAMHFPQPYVILPLDDTRLGFALQVGLKT